ncbi:MAG: hypothetical protein UR96_C0001G0012 [candidate division WS6 bacterium GW2011_GWC1_36_11]|uniref:Uncharacterized protein n=3 Tax=Candidatus Dojkabacteria TaxID=74243 RepID=A0A0G0DVX6_9BACT|nr:MAG: hypothetical protein UR96_C0001G0012 [candidate division WS6 bacterium GW2011_GWC1_36_11]KKQ04561.1 MAG: hypothetical protein US14_C0006G0004 [candidate division WS6 bacterium GW2011_WS6_36_26]KKQ17815.1 MAG: hypothetical protein US29_C0005G0002 [candidate division WS6 bacterium GW2011_GWF1_36_8]HAM96658.1 hypothetical protein [Patescibacteria group bacterium]
MDPKGNSDTFSHRIYEVFLRTCTEFENVAKQILKYNKISAIGDGYKMQDYFKLEKDLKLSDYMALNNALGVEIYPFFCLGGAKNYGEVMKNFGSGFWYQAYNEVKHNRSENFKFAKMDNLLSAVGGLAILLFTQYESNAFSPYKEASFYQIDKDGITFSDYTIWGIKKI